MRRRPAEGQDPGDPGDPEGGRRAAGAAADSDTVIDERHHLEHHGGSDIDLGADGDRRHMELP